ncbi:MAG TPA: 50S ribosomal protein L1, partial [Propionibacteriaceae bacterium]|nr:50S ribosomal protein L1 [Propionibacteriaceae bacterium]
MKRSKAYSAVAEKIDPDKVYAPVEAVEFAKANTTAKFDETLDVSVRLGVDPRKADQMVRGTVNLPNGTGKTARVLVFATGDRAAAAEAAGADEVGSDELIEKVAGGYLDFDAVVATPDLMGKVGRLGRVLGPRGLMPNPKTGTVTVDVAKAVTEIKGGKIEFRVDRHANLH